MDNKGKVLDLDKSRIAVSLDEAAEMLGVCKRTLERERDAGNLRCFRLGRVWRVRVTELDTYVRQLEQKAGA